MELTQDRVRELFDYLEDGSLIWKVRRSNRINVGDKVGAKTTYGYLMAGVDGRKYLVHRLIWLWHHGWLPQELDHRDGNGLNNRIANLRPATSTQNKANRRKYKESRSSLKGAHLDKRRNKWVAQITKDRVKIFLGYFSTEAEAHAAYMKAANEYHGEFARAS